MRAKVPAPQARRLPFMHFGTFCSVAGSTHRNSPTFVGEKVIIVRCVVQLMRIGHILSTLAHTYHGAQPFLQTPQDVFDTQAMSPQTTIRHQPVLRCIRLFSGRPSIYSTTRWLLSPQTVGVVPQQQDPERVGASVPTKVSLHTERSWAQPKLPNAARSQPSSKLFSVSKCASMLSPTASMFLRPSSAPSKGINPFVCNMGICGAGSYPNSTRSSP